MARIFEDNFNGTLGTALRSHTPDIGTSWDAPAAWPNPDSLKLDADATDAGAYCFAGTEGASVSHVDPATGSVTVRFKLNRLTSATTRPAYLLIRASTTDKSGYTVHLNVGSSRFELVRYNAGTSTAVLKTWTGVTLATPSVTEFYCTIVDTSGNPVISMFYGDDTQIGTAYTDNSVDKIVQAAGQEFGLYYTDTINVTATTGTHVAWYALDDSSTGSTPPTLTSITPDEGTEDGGTAVTLEGTDFVTGATVTIGGASATSVTFVDSTEITAVTPAGTVGARNVTVTNPSTQFSTLVNGYTYLSDDPVVTISEPAGSSVSCSVGAPLSFAGSATDLTDGSLTGSSLVWTSSDTSDGTAGVLGTGTTVSLTPTTDGARTITLTATDSDTNTGAASFILTVGTGASPLMAWLVGRARATELGGY
jgi:hypothetical protein